VGFRTWMALMVLGFTISVSGCGNTGATNHAAGFAANTNDAGLIQTTRIDPKTKTLYLKIVRNHSVKVGGPHESPTIEYKAQEITIPTGWTVRVSARDKNGPVGTSIVRYPVSSIPERYGTSFTAVKPGRYVVLPDASGSHGSVLDYITVSNAAKVPSVSSK
jgi:hypothetical protein